MSGSSTEKRRPLRLGAGWLLVSLACALPAHAVTAIPAASCLRLDQTAQALTDLHNLGPGTTATVLQQRWDMLQSSERDLQGDRAIAGLPATKGVLTTWGQLVTSFKALPPAAPLQTALTQLSQPMHAYRQALNVLITSVGTCQP